MLVNVTVRDKSGNPVRDLKPEDFTVLEDNKPQKVATFDIENTQNVPQVPMDAGEPVEYACHRRPGQVRTALPQRLLKSRRSRTAG